MALRFAFLVSSLAVLRFAFDALPAFKVFAATLAFGLTALPAAFVVSVPVFLVVNSGVRAMAGFFAGAAFGVAAAFVADFLVVLAPGFAFSVVAAAFCVENSGVRGMLGNSAALAAKEVRAAASATVKKIGFFISSCSLTTGRKRPVGVVSSLR
ncbi:hypothetical protein [Kumtagia ephedrae]|uniref:hypothetical protein n=1 Tax=Kumtagia ephedrae TaxID=2116701 RepID=UPI001FE06A75|nr:hypothetical protein [Mesorhizobium ephedrae]